MDEEHSECFICRNRTLSIDNDENNWRAKIRKTSRLEKQMDVIFILSNLLKVPNIQLVHQLRHWGNPEDWISLCDQCIQLTDKARYLFEEVRSIGKHLLEKIILSSADDDNQELGAYHGKSFEYQMKIRSFLKQNNNYGDDDNDRFLEGDKLASYLATQQISTNAQNLTVDGVDEDIVPPEVESPPEPLSSKPEVGKGPSKKRIRNRKKVNAKKNTTTTRRKEEAPVKCDFCGKEFKGKGSLDGHVKYVHEKKFPLSCHVCGLGVRSRKSLNIHLLVVHSGDPESKRLEEEEGLKLWRCEMVGCTAQYLKKDLLDNHLKRLHGGDKGWQVRFKCKFCGKGFWGRGKLRVHELTHDTNLERSWKCEICGNGFRTENYLRGHETKIHKFYKKDRMAEK